MLLGILVGSMACAAAVFTPAAQALDVNPPTRSCAKIGIIGDSKSDHAIGARRWIEADLRDRGVPHYLNTSSGRSITRAGSGTDAHTGNGLSAVRHAKRAGVTCFVIALAANDAAHTGGDRSVMRRDIDSLMRAIGPHRVDWVTSKTALARGPYSNANVQRFSAEINAARSRWPNLEVNNWQRVRETLPSWWAADGVHLDAGNAIRGRYVAESAFVAGSR
ncbi:hypothetical protein [Gordonia sp. NPDC058843]|uniref:hypothetical protein n=1 Tax=Gordonia sp. NPDC058843 TaxID=3346648 RepID=UPI0036CF23DE